MREMRVATMVPSREPMNVSVQMPAVIHPRAEAKYMSIADCVDVKE